MPSPLRNTYRRGRLTFIAYKTQESTFIVACEELCLLVEHKDLEFARLKLLAKTKSYLQNVIEGKLGEHLLNQSLPGEIKEEFYENVVRRQPDFERWTSKIETVLEDKCCA
ncbi:hypothetical protein KKF38_01310 [Patescibacteria group bacterium]|nr:hypothetical protein [Patescibacteria group bacterium]